MHFTKKDLEHLTRVYRLNLVNSITGIKPANLIGTRSMEGQSNVAIFSSVVHLGSDPALIGCILRPQHESPRDTYLNIQSTGYYTINHVPTDRVENAHFTSAKFPQEQSEFDRCGWTEEYRDDFHAPYVKESTINIGLKRIEEIPIQANNTILMIGKVQHIYLPDDSIDEDGNLDLEQAHTAGVSGVNTYYGLQKQGQFPYAHLKDVPEYLKK